MQIKDASGKVFSESVSTLRQTAQCPGVSAVTIRKLK